MNNPTRWVHITMRKATRGVVEAGRWLKDGAMGLRAGVERTMAKAPPFAIEAFTTWVRHLILAAFEITIGWLVRRLIARPRPSNVFSFPTLR
jgi:hypothetical protein